MRAAVRLTLCALLAAALWPAPARALVYDLKPGVDRGAVEAILHTRPAIRDELRVNGLRGELTVGITDLSLVDAVSALKDVLATAKHAANPSALLLEAPASGGLVRRHLIMAIGSQFKTLVFTIELPAAAFTADAGDAWPRSLPAPVGARVAQVMELDKRKITLAEFRSGAPAGVTFNDYDALLRANKWTPISGDGQRGGVYRLGADDALLVLNVFERDDGTHAALVLKRLK